MASRPPLGVALADTAGAPESPKVSRGQIIAGILADALMGLAGKPGIVAPMWAAQRKEEQDEAQWHRRRSADLEDYEKKQRMEQQYAVPPMLRDVQTWERMTPAQRQAYQQMKQVTAPDPDVFITLPNGQVYAGPRSGLAAAMMGGNAPPPRLKAPPPNAVPLGGPTPPASGGFPGPFESPW